MRLPGRRGTAAAADEWAPDAGAPGDVAAAYAEYIAGEDAAGVYPTVWPDWACRHLAECSVCGSPWMLLGAGAVWACGGCGHAAAGDPEGEDAG
jgi:hypothetical protein